MLVLYLLVCVLFNHEQELMRCSVEGPEAKRFLHSKHLLLAKLFRGTDRWTVHAALEARDKSVREPGLTNLNNPDDPATAQQRRVSAAEFDLRILYFWHIFCRIIRIRHQPTNEK